MELLTALPGYFAENYETAALLSAISKEITRFERHMEGCFADFAVSRAEGHFELWERELGIKAKSDKEDRRRAILARIGLLRTQTRDTVMSLIKAFSGQVSAAIEEGNNTVSVKITEPEGVVSDFAPLVRQLLKALPYHLTVNVSAKSLLTALTVERDISGCKMDLDIEIGG